MAEKNVEQLLQENEAHQHVLAAKAKLQEAHDLLKLALKETTPGNSELTERYKGDIRLALMDAIGAKLHI